MDITLLLSPLIGVGVALACWCAADGLVRFAITKPLPQPSSLSTELPLPAFAKFVKRRLPFSNLLLATGLISMLFFVYLGLTATLSWQGFWLMLGFIFFLQIAIIDLKYRLVLNVMTYPALGAVLVGRFLADADMMRLLLGGGLAFGVFYLTAYLKPGQLGGGDIKLALLIGLLFGFPQILWALLLATGTGAIIAIGLWAWQHSWKMTMPYAPFLCFGAILAMLYNPLSSL